jgi:hypothetical protein
MHCPMKINLPARLRSLTIRSWLPFVMFLAGSFLFFARSYPNYFVCDDYEFLGRIDLSRARTYFTKSWGYGNEYRPLLVYSYAIDQALSGNNPIGYHLTNTALHTADALLVGLLARLCQVSAAGAFLASVIFLLNPVAHESVIWIAGRPVILSAFFVLTSTCSFLRAMQSRNPHVWWAAMYAGSIASLLTYEGSVVLPLLVGFLFLRLPKPHPYRCKVHLGILLFVLLAYAGAWNWFFGFHITRFPVESSMWGAAGSLGEGLIRTLHGSLRPMVAPVYVGILAAVLQQPKGRKLAQLSLGWFFVSYLPFFIVRGYADRFAYLSSAGTALVLASGIVTLYHSKFKALGLLLAIGLPAFYAIGMQHRITMWKEAGSIALRIPREIKALAPDLKPGTTLVVLNVPNTYKHALVYLTGLERAIALQYPGVQFQLRRQLNGQTPETATVVEYSNGHIRREHDSCRRARRYLNSSGSGMVTLPVAAHSAPRVRVALNPALFMASGS